MGKTDIPFTGHGAQTTSVKKEQGEVAGSSAEWAGLLLQLGALPHHPQCHHPLGSPIPLRQQPSAGLHRPLALAEQVADMWTYLLLKNPI